MNPVFYPKKPLFLPTLRSYIAQSRFYLFFILWVRFFYFQIINKGKISQFAVKDGHHIKEVIRHQYKEKFNMMYFVRGRIESLLYPLLSVPLVRQKMNEAKVLSIGPRNEGEILLLSKLGFKWKNIIAADLFSYSPKIIVMDMHDLQFPNNNFDIVISSWVLRYSYDIQKAVDEIIRVSKDGAVVAIGFSWAPEKIDDVATDKASVGTRLRGGLKELFSYFGNHIDTIYWQIESSKEVHTDVCTIFKIKK
jgi:SAM-dependent methyltransferase